MENGRSTYDRLVAPTLQKRRSRGIHDQFSTAFSAHGKSYRLEIFYTTLFFEARLYLVCPC